MQYETDLHFSIFSLRSQLSDQLFTKCSTDCSLCWSLLVRMTVYNIHSISVYNIHYISLNRLHINIFQNRDLPLHNALIGHLYILKITLSQFYLHRCKYVTKADVGMDIDRCEFPIDSKIIHKALKILEM